MNNEKPVKPLIFTDYDKMTDTLMWLGNSKYQVKFVVQLGNRKKKNGSGVDYFHKEYSRFNERLGKETISIKRDYSYFFVIERPKDLQSIVLRPNDVEILKYLIQNSIYPWFFGSKNIFGINQNGDLCMKKTTRPVHFIINSANYITFNPIVFKYDTGELKQGISMEINSHSNIIELPIDNFLQFSSLILNTDMVNAAMTMLNYIKIKPYSTNLTDMNNISDNSTFGSTTGDSIGFFGR